MTIFVLAPLSGALVGLILGMIGGGGSILAVPLLIYVVGVSSTHVALGTSAVVVAASAAASPIPYLLDTKINRRLGINMVVTGYASEGASIKVVFLWPRFGISYARLYQMVLKRYVIGMGAIIYIAASQPRWIK